VEKGILHLENEGEAYTINAGEYALIRKYTHGRFYKTKEGTKNGFSEHIFILEDKFVKEVIHNFTLPEDFMPCTVPVVKIPGTPLMEGLMQSIKAYVSGLAQIDRDLIRLKTMEALHGITSFKPELIHILNDFSEPARADLKQFIEHNYTINLSLDQFAEMSGRSLSTFNREFRKAYNVPPHKWIKQKRLELAKKMLIHSRKASDVYLEVGFEDLAHFSRSFKSHFGINPSEVTSIAQA
jgi:AraC-like DNA-binding protein